MQSKKILKLFMIIVCIVVIIFYAIILLFPYKNKSIKSIQNIITNEQATISNQANVGLPARIKIPDINVDATFEYVGLTDTGAMDVPKNPANVAWFELGHRPGEIGNAVISGHYGWKNNTPAVFDNLYKLRKGNKIYIEDDKGTTITFVVNSTKRYSPDGDGSKIFGSSDDKARLNLITCEGVWDESSKSYSTRLVVFTEKEETK